MTGGDSSESRMLVINDMRRQESAIVTATQDLTNVSLTDNTTQPKTAIEVGDAHL